MPMMDPWMMGMMGMQNGFNFGNGNSSGSADPAMMQEMFRQNQATMEQMQAMMFQMAQQMVSQVARTRDSDYQTYQLNRLNPIFLQGTAPPVYPSSISAQPPQQLGSYTISGRKAANLINPHLSTSTTTKKLVAPPTAPLSAEICKFGVGCTNKSCIYSHPSPVASVSSGMVLKSEVCANNLKCEDKDCEKSHVSPAQLHGEFSALGKTTVYGAEISNIAVFSDRRCIWTKSSVVQVWREMYEPDLSLPSRGSNLRRMGSTSRVDSQTIKSCPGQSG
jgi:hypothetical protein